MLVVVDGEHTLTGGEHQGVGGLPELRRGSRRVADERGVDGEVSDGRGSA
jgi:hypothetical protein